jgi:hypothetical protein
LGGSCLTLRGCVLHGFGLRLVDALVLTVFFRDAIFCLRECCAKSLRAI